VTLCIIAFVVALRLRAHLEFFQCAYWRNLLVGWKIVTFTIAAIGVTVIAPYTGDPTWDYVDAALMSVFAFVGAPWSVGCYIRDCVEGNRLQKCTSRAACGCSPPAGPTISTSSCVTVTIPSHGVQT
jgi:hypothetical protein